MATDIFIERTNASKITLYIEDEGIRQEVYERYRYEEPSFTRNKWSKWDGVVRMFNRNNGSLPYGLFGDILALAKSRQWEVELDPRFKEDVVDIKMEQLDEWVSTLQLQSGGEDIEPYDYQMEGLRLGLRYSRMTLLAATSAGKSLLIYLLTRFWEQFYRQGDEKILILVPSILLVDQMFSDFKDYSGKNGWDVTGKVHQIAEGKPKFTFKNVVISTWQSLQDMPEDYFKQFGYIIEDEVHGASGKKIGSILNNSTNAYKRIGLTGTLRKDAIHPLQVQSLFGPIKRIVSTRELIESGKATPTNIKFMQLNYSDYEANIVSTMTYQQEIEFIVGHAYRKKVLKTLAMSLKGNTLILFDRKEKHLNVIRDELADIPGKTVYVINGDVSLELRSEIKKKIENGEDIILLATYGTMSTGVSIKKLNNLVFAHPSKSIIRTLQSIGRLLRLHECKDVANIYDLVDNFKCGNLTNFALDHAMERYGFYREEQHPVSIKKVEMKNHEEVM